MPCRLSIYKHRVATLVPFICETLCLFHLLAKVIFSLINNVQSAPRNSREKRDVQEEQQHCLSVQFVIGLRRRVFRWNERQVRERAIQLLSFVYLPPTEIPISLKHGQVSVAASRPHLI